MSADTDKAVADYLAMTNDLLIAMATQLETLRKGIGVLQAAQGVTLDAAPQQHAIPQAAPQYQPIGWVCPQHGTVKVVQAGVSHRNCPMQRDCPGGLASCKPYESFTTCGSQGCNAKPPRIQPAAPARAIPPSQMP